MNFDEMKDKAGQALNSEKGEQVSDQALQKGEQFADEHIGERDSGQSGR